MGTHYLVDYENVHENGLTGSDKLKSSDCIHIFYTENAKSVTLDIFNNHGKAGLFVKKVPTGEQSLDIHLVSYLGYLIGANEKKKTEFVIVSNDSGYDRIIKFWREEKNVSVLRRKQIEPEDEKPKNETGREQAKPENKTGKERPRLKNGAGRAQSKPKREVPQSKKLSKPAPAKKTKLNQEVQQALSKADTKNNRGIINTAAKIAAHFYGSEHFMQEVHNELRRVYPQDYLKIYEVIKPILGKYDVAQGAGKDISDKAMLIKKHI